MTEREITIRRGTPEDTRPAFDLSMAAMRDLFTRQGHAWALEPQAFCLEARAHACGMDSISFEVPTINETAMRHLLARGFQFDAPLTLFMSDVAFGQFDRFLGFSPAIVL